MQLPLASRFAGLPALLWAAGPLAAQVPAGGPLEPDFVDRAPYRVLTHDVDDGANFNAETVDGLAFTADGSRLYALNTHQSTVVELTGLAPEPSAVWPTLLNPVSLAWWQGELVVACAGTHALAWHDEGDGAIRAVLPLPSEPAGLVVDDDRGHAFVACQGANVVCEVDLASATLVRTYELDERRPRFLWLDPGDPLDPQDARVYVAPLLSGNDTAVKGPGAGNSGQVLDLDDPAVAPAGGLPDFDLLRIDPFAGTLTPVFTGVGTLLLEHGRHPTTGAYWMLTVESHNQLPGVDTEREHRGVFASNELVIAPDPATVASPLEPSVRIDLDDAIPQTPEPDYAAATSLSFPYALAFEPTSGRAYVASSTGDLVARLAPDGTRLADFPLPAGSIPRDLALDPVTGTALYVYCWGTNDVLVFDALDPDVPPTVLELGFDPTPSAVRDGRTIWYDAHRSLQGRSSCNVCHPNGGLDLLGWRIPNEPVDHKDVMVTQSLFGIEDSFPYHWRGENDLAAFNDAFVGLLGGPAKLDEVPGGDAERLYAFLFSLQGAANPNQSLKRELDDARTPQPVGGLVGSAVRGQQVFHGVPAVQGRTCNGCHRLPIGTNGDVVNEIGNDISAQVSFDVAHFRQLTQRDQPVVDVELASGTVSLPLNGFGFQHNGARRSLLDFIDIFPLSAQQVADCVAFVRQFDEGLAPAAHAARHYHVGASPAVEATIEQTLIPQAELGWIDLVAFGTYSVGGGPDVFERWWYDPTLGQFVSDSVTGPKTTWTNFVNRTQNGAADNVFLGLPAGNGPAFALDHDRDGLWNDDETALGSDPYDPDSDGDGWLDGHEEHNAGGAVAPALDPDVGPTDTTLPTVVAAELDFARAAFCKYHVEFSEPVTWTVTYDTPGATAQSRTRLDWVVRDTVVLQGLEASSPGFAPNAYAATLTFQDRAGLQGTFALPSAQTSAHHVATSLNSRVEELVLTSVRSLPGGDLQLDAEVAVSAKLGALPKPPLADCVVIFNVLVEDTATGDWQVSSTFSGALPSFDVAGEAYDATPGPFLLSPLTAADGRASVSLVQPGLARGQRVRLNVLTVMRVVDPAGYDPQTPAFGDPVTFKNPQTEYQMPRTPADARGLEASY